MTPTTLFILAATCSLAVPVALFLVLWRRDTRRLAADNQASEARERDATSRLAAAEARLAAAEQALSAEKELRQRYEGQVQALTEQRTRTEAELAALRASSEAEIASLRAKNAEDRAAEKAEREKLEETFRAQFRNLATEILGEQSKHFKETNKESLDVLLKPFRDNIAEFRKRVEDIYTTQTAQRGELKAELKNLKSQLNPHFLFNMLNNVYVLIRKGRDEAAEVLFKLEDLLRYQFNDSTQDRIQLSSDIRFMNDFLNLEKIRRDNFNYTISKEGDINSVWLPPLLFIPFVENAVKHNTDGENASFVYISFNVQDNRLFFRCENSKPAEEEEKNNRIGGLGLKNIRRRLELLYPGRHSLEIIEDKQSYIVNLYLDL